jgi:hypothetical protein
MNDNQGGRLKSDATEEVMRIITMAIGLAAFAVATPTQPAAAAKSKMGCEIGSEIWSATDGKCVPGKPKYTKSTSSKAPAKKAPAKKPAQ